MALPLFTITLFVSAFLLFLVQPLIGKMILPKLGGTPQVWNTCMMFFQTVLLVGYAYSHTVSTRLALKKQMIVHCLFLLVPLGVLAVLGPFTFIKTWVPPADENPIPQTLWLLTIVVGIPFLVVSTTAPLLQRWFSFSGEPTANDPYFLYGASNLGSLLALVVYPFIIEPAMVVLTQAYVWWGGFVVFMGLVVACAMRIWKVAPPEQLEGAASEQPPVTPPAAPEAVKETSTAIQPASAALRGTARKKGGSVKLSTAAVSHVPVGPVYDPRTEPVTWTRRLRWILLAAVPSSLMLGVTSHASIDLSPFPLLWVVPLALYLLSFILVFSKWPVVWTEGPHKAFLFAGPLAILVMSLLIILSHDRDPSSQLKMYVFLSFAGFFFVACMCHGEFAKDRPSPRYLTEYFLLMSVGGMIGGVFNGLFAPVFFNGVAEYPLAIIAACFMRPRSTEGGWLDQLIVRSSPNLEKWLEDTGDQLAASFGAKPRHSTYLLSYALDVTLALLVFGLAYWLRDVADSRVGSGWHNFSEPRKNGLLWFTQFFGFAPRDAKLLDEWVENWYQVWYNAGAFGIVLVISFFFAHRPWRFGLTMAGILAANIYFLGNERNVVHSDRTYFGRIRVLDELDPAAFRCIEANNFPDIKSRDPNKVPRYHSLMHGTTHHGKNYYDPEGLARIATTYYHRWGPVGIVMERYNWLKGPQNTYWSDNRLPVSLIGLGATPLNAGGLPMDQLAQLWSEPPFATVGLGTGTMASYGRPYQHVVFYEIDEKIRNFSLPIGSAKQPYYNYLQGSLKRGSSLEVIMGDARQSMQRSTPALKFQRDTLAAGRDFSPADMPHGTARPGSIFYVEDGKIMQDKDHHRFPEREKYYKVIVVDAFSSDAIPIHMTTKEAIELYMDQLQDDGVLCMHTSNRHMDLTKPIVDIADALKLTYVIGHDQGTERTNAKFSSLGHFGSEYVMISRSKDRFNFVEKKGSDGKIIPALERMRPDPTKEYDKETNPYVGMNYDALYHPRGRVKMWFVPEPANMPLWTDDYSNIISILR